MATAASMAFSIEAGSDQFLCGELMN